MYGCERRGGLTRVASCLNDRDEFDDIECTVDVVEDEDFFEVRRLVLSTINGQITSDESVFTNLS